MMTAINKIGQFFKMIFLSASATVVLVVIFPFIPHKILSLFRLYIVETEVEHTSENKDLLIQLLEEKDLLSKLFDEGVYRSDANKNHIAIWFKTREDAILFQLKVGSGQDLVKYIKEL